MKDKHKIIIIGSIPPPFHGGTIYTKQLLNSELNNAFQIIYLNTSDHRDSDNYNKLDFANVSIATKNILSLIKELIKSKPDIVDCSPAPYILPFFRESIFILLTKVLSKAKIVVHIHAGKFFTENFYNNSNSLIRAYIRFIFKKCDCGIVLGKLLVKYFKPFFKKTVYLWNGIGEIPSSDKYENKIINENKISIGFFSNICKEKGIITFIKAIDSLDQKILDKIDITIAGDWMPGEENTKNEFFKIVNNNLNNKINMIGGIYNTSKKRDFYLSLQIFVHPSRMEAFPLVILEAMANRCCVISTYEGAIPEIVIDGKTGLLIERDDYLTLSKKLSELVCSKEKIKRLGNNSRKKVIKQFTLSHNIKGLKTILNDLILN